VPERLDRVRLCALALSDLVFVLNVLVSSREMIEPLLENGDFALVGAGFLNCDSASLARSLKAVRLTLAFVPKGDVGKYRETQVSPLICASALNSSSVGISM
jgi:hypothetical protein